MESENEKSFKLIIGKMGSHKKNRSADKPIFFSFKSQRFLNEKNWPSMWNNTMFTNDIYRIKQRSGRISDISAPTCFEYMDFVVTLEM